VTTIEGYAPSPGAARVCLTPSARNAAILRAARDVLLALPVAATDQPAARHPVVDVATRTGSSSLGRRVVAVLACSDLAAVLAAWLLTDGPLSLAWLGVPAAVAFVVGTCLDLYRPHLELSALDDLPAQLLTGLLAVLAAVAAAGLSGRRAPSAQWCLAFGAALVIFLAAGRVCAYASIRRLRRGGRLVRPAVVIGAGEVGQRLGGILLAHPEYGLAPVGFVDSGARAAGPDRSALPLLGGLDALPDVLRRHGARDAVFAFGAVPDALSVGAVRACVGNDVQVFVVPRYFEFHGAGRRARTEMVWGIPLVRLRRWPLRPSRARVKRASDVVLSAFGLLALSPVIAVCALVARLDGGPGVVFRQVRVGRDGRPFTLLKFRSMRPAGDEGERRWSIDGDERISRFGRFLRRTSLDELPQLVNVLRGDMSIVGPRPERPYFVQHFTERFRRYGDRLRTPGGLTGWAQVNGLRGNTPIDERVAFDNDYIDNWSLWYDIKIILRTIPSMLRRH
jgi:exopolysaccharide biosynthesis polyprenyl glycosylphosphotransferase